MMRYNSFMGTIIRNDFNSVDRQLQPAYNFDAANRVPLL